MAVGKEARNSKSCAASFCQAEAGIRDVAVTGVQTCALPILNSSKQRYPHWQKLVLCVFMASRKLKHYFQEHPITVVSSAPLADIIQNREATGRIAKWAIELGAYHIKYNPRTHIKSQALADFIND